MDQYEPEVKILSDAGIPHNIFFWHDSIIITEFVNCVGSIRLLRNETSEVLLSEKNVTYGTLLTGKLIPTENRLYIFANNKTGQERNLLFININFEIVKIEETLSKEEKK